MTDVHRRNLILHGPVLAAGSMLFSSETRAAATAARSARLSSTIADHVATVRFESLSPKALKMTKYSLLDAIGVSLAATGLEPACRPILDLVLDNGGKKQSGVMGSDVAVPAAQAALANGSLAHALDYEDSHEPSRTHPNAAVVAAALAVAQAMPGTSGRDLIIATALGCDLVCRLGMAEIPNPAHPGNRPGFYRPAVLGTMGAAAAAARLYRLDRDRVLDALSFAMCQNSVSSEILNSAISQVRAIRDCYCAQAGVLGAQFAARGVRGFEKPLEGKDGFFAMFMDGEYEPDVMTSALGRTFHGQDIAFKPWPACRDTHMYIQAALDFIREYGIPEESIDKIEAIVAPSALIICEPAASKIRPSTAIDAKFSIYFTIATALLNGKVDLSSFSGPALADEKTLNLASRISYRVDSRIAKTRSKGGSDFLIVKTKTGESYPLGIDNLAGSIEAPLSDDDLYIKFVDCCRNARRPVRRDVIDRMADLIRNLEREQNLSRLFSLIFSRDVAWRPGAFTES